MGRRDTRRENEIGILNNLNHNLGFAIRYIKILRSGGGCGDVDWVFSEVVVALQNRPSADFCLEVRQFVGELLKKHVVVKLEANQKYIYYWMNSSSMARHSSFGVSFLMPIFHAMIRLSSQRRECAVSFHTSKSTNQSILQGNKQHNHCKA